MNALEVAQRQVDAWNGHDADALITLYAEGATYHNPRFDHPLKGKALGDFLKSVLTAFPDFRLVKLGPLELTNRVIMAPPDSLPGE
jgi:hypothetical protein